MSKEQRQGFLQGAMILTVSTIAVKVVALFYTMALGNVLEESSMAYYNAAYVVFSLLNAATVSGLPIAVSRMVSSAYAMGRKKQADRIFGVAMLACMALGIVFTLLMFFFSGQIAAFLNQPKADYSIKALAPTVFFCALMSAVRGYYQGRSNMLPTAISQTLEAVSKLLVGISLATYVHVTLQESGAYASAAAILGVSASAGIGMLFLLLYHRRQKTLDAQNPQIGTDDTITGRKEILAGLIKFAVPITIGACFLFGLDILDTTILNGGLKSIFPVPQADKLYGIWGNVGKIYDLPGAMVIALSTSMLPALTAAFTRKDHRRVVRTASSALRITFLVTIPCAVGFVLFGGPVAGVLFFTRPDTVNWAGKLLPVLAASVVFNGLLYTTNSIMQSMGHTVRPVIHMAIGGAVRVTVNYLLVSNPDINIMSAAIATLASNFMIMILNMFAVYRLIPGLENPLKTVVPALLAAALMGAGAYGVYWVLSLLISGKIATIAGVAVAVVLYMVFGILLRAIRPGDIRMLPKGDRIVKKLGLYEGAHFE